MSLAFDIEFHGPFHVSTGNADDGTDITVDLRNPLPATSIKGLLRAEAAERLGLPASVVEEIFGRSTTAPDDTTRRGAPGRWWFSDVSLGDVQVTPFARVSVDERGRAREGMLAFGQQVWATRGTFRIEPLRHLDGEVRARHELVLRAAARSVSSLGGDRRRGSGWVTITESAGAGWTAEDTETLLALRSQA